jgi:hypothetical protein
MSLEQIFSAAQENPKFKHNDFVKLQAAYVEAQRLGITNYRVETIADDTKPSGFLGLQNTNLYAVGFIDPAKPNELMPVARGTNGIRDWRGWANNASNYIYGTSPATNQYLSWLNGLSGQGYTLAGGGGHSQGGYMNKVAALFVPGMGDVHAFNSPGFSPWVALALYISGNAKDAHLINDYRNFFDFVSTLGISLPGQGKHTDWRITSGFMSHDLFGQFGIEIFLYGATVDLIEWARGQYNSARDLSMRILAWGARELAALKAEIDNHRVFVRSILSEIRAKLNEKGITKERVRALMKALGALLPILGLFAAAAKYLAMLIKSIGTGLKKAMLALQSAINIDITVNLQRSSAGLSAARRAANHIAAAQEQLNLLNQATRTLRANVATYNKKAVLEQKPKETAYPVVMVSVSTGSLNGTKKFFTQVTDSFTSAESFATRRLATV